MGMGSVLNCFQWETARLGTWMPFRTAQRKLAFFLGVEAAEASVRHITEQAGAAEVEALLAQRPESLSGPEVQLLSLPNTEKSQKENCPSRLFYSIYQCRHLDSY
jgi:hypothetical protein